MMEVSVAICLPRHALKSVKTEEKSVCENKDMKRKMIDFVCRVQGNYAARMNEEATKGREKEKT